MNPPQSTKTAPHQLQAAPLPRQFLAIVISSAAAIIANVILYFILQNVVGVKFIAPEQLPSPEVSPLPFTDVILFSAIFSAGASIVFLLVANMVRRPAPAFVTISVIVLVASFLLPLRIPTPPIPMSTKLALVSMHILGAAVLVPLLIRIGLSRKTDKQ